MASRSIMPLKWRLEFRSTGHRTTEADCDGEVTYSTRKAWGWQCCCTLQPKGKPQATFLSPCLYLSMWLLLCFNLQWGLEGQAILRGQRHKRGEEEGEEISFQNTRNWPCWKKDMWTFAKWCHSSILPCIKGNFFKNLLLLLINETDWLAVCFMTKSDRV